MGSGSWAETHKAVSRYQGRIPSVGQIHYVSRLYRSKCMCLQHQRTHTAYVSLIDRRHTDRECFHFSTPERTYVQTPSSHYKNRFRNYNRYLQLKAKQSSELNLLRRKPMIYCYEKYVSTYRISHTVKMSRCMTKGDSVIKP